MKIDLYCTRRAWRILGVMTLLCGSGLWAEAAGGRAAKESAVAKEASKTAAASEEPSGAAKPAAGAAPSDEKPGIVAALLGMPRPEMSLFYPKHAPAEDLSKLAIRVLAPESGSGFRIAVDYRTNALIVVGTKEEQEQVVDFLKTFDVPVAAEKKEEKQQGSAWVEVWWVGGEPKDKGIITAEALKELTPKLLDGNGMLAGGVRLLAQTLVTTSTDGKFQVQCSPILENTPVQWSVSGSVKERAKDMAELQVQISVSEGRGAASKVEDPYGSSSTRDYNAPPTLTKRSATVAGASGSAPDLLGLNTTITARYGHDVVLGITATPKMSSVFVIRVNRENR